MTERSIVDQAMDLLIFAPTGLLLTAVEDLPGMAAKGRAKVELQVRNAQMIGRFAVTLGRKDLAQRFGRLTGAGSTPPTPHDAAPTTPTSTATATATATAPKAPKAPTAPTSTAPKAPIAKAPIPPAPPASRFPVASAPRRGQSTGPLAIPDYDALSASQVVRRLEGLTPEELEDVRRHEAGGRRRRTILNRIQQLLGGEDLESR